jgi:flagellum-specific ATP synthase
LAKVIGFNHDEAQVMPYRDADGLSPGDKVVTWGRSLRIPSGAGMKGRVVNGLGEPIDGLGPLRNVRWQSVTNSAPPALSRVRITQPFLTGQRVIDGLLTIGRGQRIGLFAGSGVGKSTLLGEIAKGAESDTNVIALIGERGREVLPFIDDCLGPEGLARSVIVVSTSDEMPLMRVQAALTATTIADGFRRQGQNVLFLLDSLTRLALAQRELGLHLREPPTTRGYTPSVFQLLSQLLERLGNNQNGSITGILTVLVEGDELEEPITDTVRGIVDGHVVLSRKIANSGRFPAVDVLRSLSRLFREITTPAQQEAAGRIRDMLSAYEESADLIRIGAYQRGASAALDCAIDTMPAIETFLRQRIDERTPWHETLDALQKIASRWKYS